MTSTDMVRARLDHIRAEVEAAKRKNQAGELSPVRVHRVLVEVDRLAEEVQRAVKAA